MRTEEIYHFASMGEISRHNDQDAMFKYMQQNIEQEEYCAHFGCGKVLTMTEQLYGTKCQEHSVTPKQDITKHINY